ncbi:odorant receptor 67d-like [Haematobia irritans]|uniref:odorant receptor 67d-like n=1 Tax=Haematobia irritans TaxID=7368 RepID=UPI003F4F8E5C
MSEPIVITSPSERFLKLFGIIKKCAAMCGGNVLDVNFRMTAMTWFILILVNTFILFNVYTIYVCVVIEHDYPVVLQSLCVAGSGIQGSSKLINGIIHQKKLRFVCSEITYMYKHFEHKSANYLAVLNESVIRVRRIMLVTFKIYFVLTMGLLSVPVYYKLVHNETIYIMRVLIPGIKEDTDWGFTTLQIYNAACIIFSGFGNFAADCVCFVTIAHIPLMKDLFKCKFEDLQDILRQVPVQKTNTQPVLKDIFLWHQRYLIVSNNNIKSLFWSIFAQIVSSFMGIVCNVVCMFLGTWPVAPMYLLSSTVCLVCYCAMGNMVEIANEDVFTIIYDSSWYELSVSEQKMVLVMLRQSQKPNSLSVGGLYPLSMNTGLQLAKSIYTIAMMLHQNLN